MAPREHDRIPFDGITLGVGITPETHSSALSRVAVGAPLAPLRPARRTGWTYLAQAAIHPSNLLLLIGVMFLSLILWSAPVLFAGLGVEGVFLCLVPRLRFFRVRIDEMLDEADRAAAAKAREALVLQMGEAHRQELAKIEALVGKTFANVERRGGVSAMGFGDPFGLAQLATSYIRLAIAHKACEESLAMTNRHVLEGTIRSLEAAEIASPDRTKELLRRRLAIAYRRAECWTRTRENLEAIGHQLATITELVQLVHQESLVPPDPAGVGEVLDRFLSEFEESAGTLRELSELGVEDAYELCDYSAEAQAMSSRRSS
ncbi:Hypothetical protein A7982_00286 [Minicystis rosea]|nr:Hypothetical protein A7982_00286 [Minicystis rosea]